MSHPAPSRPGAGPTGPARPGRSRRPARYTAAGPTAGRNAARAGLLVGLAVVALAVAGVGGLAIGSHPVPLGTTIDAIFHYDPTNSDHLIVVKSRVPRLVLGIVVGAALGAAGALMQAVTRNPLAEPGLLGVNAGAAFAVVIAIGYLGVTTVGGYLWFAFIGAALSSVLVYLLGTAHRSQGTPVRMALAGAAISVLLLALTNSMLLGNQAAFNQFRYWAVGSLQGRGLDVTVIVLPFVLAGVAITLVLIRPLNAIALGEDASRALGVNPGVTRAGAAIAVVLLAGAATAAAVPIGFVGLAAPHIVRSLVGPDQRLLLPTVLVVAPAFLVAADTVGRWAIAPGELQTGIAAAVLGGPVFVMLVRSRRMASL